MIGFGFGEFVGYAGKGADRMIGRLGAGADWVIFYTARRTHLV
jgi:hypothetical protein